MIESHGTYDPISELPLNPYSDIEKVEVLHDDEDYTVVTITTSEDIAWTIGIANKESNLTKRHSLDIGKDQLNWSGPYTISKL